MIKRSFIATGAIVTTALLEGAALADVAPDPIPGEEGGGTLVVALVALVAIVAAVAIILFRRAR